jgi:hypothetical protein
MAKKCYGIPPVCITTSDCDPLDPSCTPTTIGRSYSRGRGLGHTAYHHVGDTSSSAISLVRTAAVGAAAFHGYRRNKSVLWAVIWAVLAGISPLVTTGVAVAQGFGKPKGK